MKTKSEYEHVLENFYFLKSLEIRKIANKIKKMHYSIPLEIDDLISFSYLKLLESENKLKYFEIKIQNGNVKDCFFLRKNKILYVNIL